MLQPAGVGPFSPILGTPAPPCQARRASVTRKRRRLTSRCRQATFWVKAGRLAFRAGSRRERALLDRLRLKAWGQTHIQRFSVEYDYPVVFTREAFDPANPVLVDVLRRRELD